MAGMPSGKGGVALLGTRAGSGLSSATQLAVCTAACLGGSVSGLGSAAACRSDGPGAPNPPGGTTAVSIALIRRRSVSARSTTARHSSTTPSGGSSLVAQARRVRGDSLMPSTRSSAQNESCVRPLWRCRARSSVRWVSLQEGMSARLGLPLHGPSRPRTGRRFIAGGAQRHEAASELRRVVELKGPVVPVVNLGPWWLGRAA